MKYLKTCSKMFHMSKKCGKNAGETFSERYQYKETSLSKKNLPHGCFHNLAIS